jgi:CheY-like chemotaxis protein
MQSVPKGPTETSFVPRENLISETPLHATMRILVVEDDEETAQSTARLLRIWGHAVQLAQNGPTALQAISDAFPDVVLIDIGLAGMDGCELAKKIREGSDQRRPLFIAITGYGAEEDRRRSADAGIDLHLVKPYDPEQLQTLLERFQKIIL